MSSTSTIPSPIYNPINCLDALYLRQDNPDYLYVYQDTIIPYLSPTKTSAIRKEADRLKRGGGDVNGYLSDWYREITTTQWGQWEREVHQSYASKVWTLCNPGPVRPIPPLGELTNAEDPHFDPLAYDKYLKGKDSGTDFPRGYLMGLEAVEEVMGEELSGFSDSISRARSEKKDIVLFLRRAFDEVGESKNDLAFKIHNRYIEKLRERSGRRY